MLLKCCCCCYSVAIVSGVAVVSTKRNWIGWVRIGQSINGIQKCPHHKSGFSKLGLRIQSNSFFKISIQSNPEKKSRQVQSNPIQKKKSRQNSLQSNPIQKKKSRQNSIQSNPEEKKKIQTKFNPIQSSWIQNLQSFSRTMYWI